MEKGQRELHLKAVRMLTATTLFWALSFPIARAINLTQAALLPDHSSWFHASLTSTMRFGCAAVILLLLCARTIRKITLSEIWQGAGLGIFGSVGILFQMDGLAYTDASISAFLTQTFCIWVPIYVALRTRKWPAKRLAIATLGILLGVAILTKVNVRSFRLDRGEWETLISAVFFAGQIIWLDRVIFRENNVNRFSLVMFVTMMLVALPIVLGTARSAGAVVRCYSNPTILGLTGSLILFCTLFAFVWMNKWQPFLPATEAAIIYGAEPVLASAFALFLPGIISRYGGIHYENETLTAQLFIGGALIVGANLYLQAGWLSKARAGKA